MEEQKRQFWEGLWLQDGLFRQKRDGNDIYDDDGFERQRVAICGDWKICTKAYILQDKANQTGPTGMTGKKT